MTGLTKVAKFFTSEDIAVYDGIDGLLDSLYQPSYAVLSFHKSNGALSYKSIELNNGIIRIVSSEEDGKQCYGLVLGAIECELSEGSFQHTMMEDVIEYGENFKAKVFTNGVDEKSLKKYLKLLNNKKERDRLTEDEFDYLEENPYITLDILDVATQDAETLDNLITIIFCKMMNQYEDELFALGGNSGHYDKTIESVREIFTVFFKDIKEKYIPMIK